MPVVADVACVSVQLQQGASAVRDMVMVLVGRKVAPQRTWLPLLFHTIPVMEGTHPPVFTHADTQQLLSRVQVMLACCCRKKTSERLLVVMTGGLQELQP